VWYGLTARAVGLLQLNPPLLCEAVGGDKNGQSWKVIEVLLANGARKGRSDNVRPPFVCFNPASGSWRNTTVRFPAAERRHPTGRERMGSPTLQTLQDPILLLSWLCFRGGKPFPVALDRLRRREAKRFSVTQEARIVAQQPLSATHDIEGPRAASRLIWCAAGMVLRCAERAHCAALRYRGRQPGPYRDAVGRRRVAY
jgi:hypothetical protein